MNCLEKMDRELVYSTLFNLLKTVDGFNYYSRRLKHWNEVLAPDTPALFLIQGKESAQTITGMQTKWTFNADVYIYVNVGSEQEITPYSTLNPLVDSVIYLFDAENNRISQGKQDLGGLIHEVRINGVVENDGGNLGPIAIAIIPLEIIVAA